MHVYLIQEHKELKINTAHVTNSTEQSHSSEADSSAASRYISWIFHNSKF
jgi:hypothetical protein